VGTIAPDHVLCSDRFNRASFVFQLRSGKEIRSIVGSKIGPEQTVLHGRTVRRCRRSTRSRFLLCKVTKGDFDGIGIVVVGFGRIKLHALRQNASLDSNVGVFGDRIQEETLDSSLMQHHLLESRDAGGGVRDPITALDLPFVIWIPQVDLQHVIGFPPHSVGEVETVEDFERATLETVGLAVEDLAGMLACIDASRLAGMIPTLVPLLSMIRVLTPSLLIQFAVISPAGPAPTMSTSTALLSIDVAPILFFLGNVAVQFECPA
jgi:hypothetical protein